jgi:hypothetical protein
MDHAKVSPDISNIFGPDVWQLGRLDIENDLGTSFLVLVHPGADLGNIVGARRTLFITSCDLEETLASQVSFHKDNPFREILLVQLGE